MSWPSVPSGKRENTCFVKQWPRRWAGTKGGAHSVAAVAPEGPVPAPQHGLLPGLQVLKPRGGEQRAEGHIQKRQVLWGGQGCGALWARAQSSVPGEEAGWEGEGE